MKFHVMEKFEIGYILEVPHKLKNKTDIEERTLNGTEIFGSGRSAVPPVLNSLSTDQQKWTVGRSFVEKKIVPFLERHPWCSPFTRSQTNTVPFSGSYLYTYVLSGEECEKKQMRVTGHLE